MKVELAPEALAPLRTSINNFLGLKSAGDLLNTGAYPKLEQLETAATIWDQLHDSICVKGGGSYLDPKREDVAVIVVGDAPMAPISTMFAFRSHWTVFCVGQAVPSDVNRLYPVFRPLSDWRLRNPHFKDVVVVVMGTKDRAQAINSIATGVKPWVVAVAKGDPRQIASTGFQDRFERIKLLDAAPGPFWWADIDLTVSLLTDALYMAIWEPSDLVQFVRAPGVPRVPEPPAKAVIDNKPVVEQMQTRHGHELPPPCDHKGCHEAYATQQRWLKRQAEAKPTPNSSVESRKWETAGKATRTYHEMAMEKLIGKLPPLDAVKLTSPTASLAEVAMDKLINDNMRHSRAFTDPILEINLSRFPAGTTPQDIMAAAATPQFQQIAREELAAQVHRQKTQLRG